MTKSIIGHADTGGETDYVLELQEVGTHAVLSAMTVSPETTAEDGYIRVNIAGTVYQIPLYAE